MKVVVAAVLGIIIGFASATAIQSLLDAAVRSKAKRTAADCRALSAALESYRAEHGKYPPLDGNVENLRPFLAPRYLKSMPTVDMSGQPYFVVMNGERATVISTGKYGVVVEAGKVVRPNPASIGIAPPN